MYTVSASAAAPALPEVALETLFQVGRHPDCGTIWADASCLFELNVSPLVRVRCGKGIGAAPHQQGTGNMSAAGKTPAAAACATQGRPRSGAHRGGGYDYLWRS